jgi:hypothetical protein
MVLLGVALVLGIVILNQFDGGPVNVDTRFVSEPRDQTTTTRRADGTVPIPTTRAVRPPEEVKVLAANGTATLGFAGRTTDYLRTVGYNALAPTDATRVVEATQVQHTAEFEAEARALAQLLQLPASSIRPMEENPPVPDTRGTDIALIIGPDLRLPGDTATTTSTTRR